MDLDDNDNNFKYSYNRDKNIEKFILDRNKLIELSKNVNFIGKNSLYLTFETDLYDLIWVDGAHGYPVVTIDIINAIRLISENGIILCDDVFKKK